MDSWTVFPDKVIDPKKGPVAQKFWSLNIRSFADACAYVHHLPYGYNSNRDDLMILFDERMGSCTTKHAVIATLAQELDLPVHKAIGIYAMTEIIVTGTQSILDAHELPYLPMVHCFLVFASHRVDLTEGNRNGKNQSLEEFLHVQIVEPNISGKEEYLLYRKVLGNLMVSRNELGHLKIRQILQAREEGIILLKSKVR
jgi:hypothetical protein